MSTLVEQIKANMVKAMKGKNADELSTLRLLISELEKEKVALKLTDVNSLSNEQTLNVISRQIKKLDKEIESYVIVGRSVEKQEAEKAVLYSYLPKQLTEDELETLVMEAIAMTETGMIKNPMQQLSKLKGRADMSKIAQIVKKYQK